MDRKLTWFSDALKDNSQILAHVWICSLRSALPLQLSEELSCRESKKASETGEILALHRIIKTGSLQGGEQTRRLPGWAPPQNWTCGTTAPCSRQTCVSHTYSAELEH